MDKSPKRILIVDDEEDITWTLSKRLARDNDKFEVLCANSGREALGILNKAPVDLVITDVRMPEVSGLELLLKIRDRFPSTRVIIMTAYGSSDIQQEANSRGCFQYIEKPFEIEDLRQIILSGLEEESGFKGSVSDFQLSDIIQLNCLGRLTISLSVKHANEQGTIYFRDGNIVHAQLGHLVGEEAFYHIMRWNGGEFSVNKEWSIPQETIFNSWQSLLLESMRQADENSAPIKEEVIDDLYWRQKKIDSLLSKLKSAQGVRHILVYSDEGVPIFYAGTFAGEKAKIDALSDEFASMIGSFRNQERILNHQAIEYWEVQLESSVIFLYKIPYQEAFFALVGDKQLNHGFIRLEIKNLLRQIAQLV